MYSKGIGLKVKDRKMAVSELGSGDRTIIFLPGLGCPSATVEFRGTAEFLKEKYLMMFVDFFGYGFSDSTNEPRKTEIIVEELHDAISQLGLGKYVLTAHSMSGLTALEYANKYPDEVEAVVGIDCCVPKQYEVRSDIENTANFYEKRSRMKDSAVNKNVTKLICKTTLRSCKDYKFSRDEIKLYTQLSIENSDSPVTLNEIASFGENALSLQGKKFPSQIPVMFLLSKQTIKQFPEWVQWHEDVISENKSKIVLLNGNHNLHLSCAKEVAQNISEFIG